ncbi:hypothetical protein HaLaN_21864, partial [Haematococcus lacustris]
MAQLGIGRKWMAGSKAIVLIRRRFKSVVTRGGRSRVRTLRLLLSLQARVDKVAITSTDAESRGSLLKAKMPHVYQCPHCSDTFACIASTMQHMEAVHAKKSPLPKKVPNPGQLQILDVRDCCKMLQDRHDVPSFLATLVIPD